MKKQVVNLENKKVKDLALNIEVFGVKILPDIIHQYIRFQNAKSRQGTHKTKSRSEVNGRAKKPFSQKGTGNARQGSSKPPHFRGGATSMGPVPRDHSFSLNKKEKKLALKSALSSKIQEDNIIFLDKLQTNTHKTKDLVKKLNNFDFNSALFVYGDDKIDDNFKKASSNLPNVSLLNCNGINVKDLILNETIFIDEKSIDLITKRLLWKPVKNLFLMKKLLV